jgi:hypothetical protein
LSCGRWFDWCESWAPAPRALLRPHERDRRESLRTGGICWCCVRRTSHGKT